MKRAALLLCLAAAPLLRALINGDGNANYAATGVQTQGLYLRDPALDQPLIGAKFSLSGTQRFWRFYARLSEKTDPAKLGSYKLFKTSVPYFAPAVATELTGATPSVSGRNITFDFWQSGSGPSHTLKSGDHLWLTARVAADTPGGAEIDVAITNLHVNGIACLVSNEAPEGAGMAYEYRRHVVPYYRMGHVGGWNDAYYDVVSDVVFFYMQANASGGVVHGWQGKQYDDASFADALERLRDGRGARPVRLLLGIGHCASALSTVCRDATLRATLVDNLVARVEQFGFDGIDIDWEYPASAADWRALGALVAELRPRLFALGGGKVLSAAVTGQRLYQAVNDYGLDAAEFKGLLQQLDFLSMMSYDGDSADGHANDWLFNSDLQRAQEIAGMPKAKICSGLPFYTNTYPRSATQMGYNWVYANYPGVVDATDIFTASDGTVHTYNSVATVASKAKTLRAGGFGAMIWAYDCDIAYANAKSLARALAENLLPGDGLRGAVSSPAEWAMMDADAYTLEADLVLGDSDLRPNAFSGTLDGQGHTLTLAGGGAAFRGTLTGAVRNLDIRVEGALSANGALCSTFSGDGRAENITLVLPENAAINGSNNVGGLVGTLYASSASQTATIANCAALLSGTLYANGHGRVGGLVGTTNQDAYAANAAIENCRAELFPSATLRSSSNATYPAVGGVVGNCNRGHEPLRNNTAVLYAGATLSGNANVGALVGGSSFGTPGSHATGNIALLESGHEALAAPCTDAAFDFTMGAPDPAARQAPVTFVERTTRAAFRLLHPVNFTAAGYRLRLR